MTTWDCSNPHSKPRRGVGFFTELKTTKENIDSILPFVIPCHTVTVAWTTILLESGINIWT
jgi:hypothetical protein